MHMVPVGKFYAIQAKINDSPYLFEIDTGSAQDLQMHKSLLDIIETKEFFKLSEWRDVNCKSYKTPVFILDKIEFEQFSIQRPSVREEPYEFSSIGEDSSSILGIDGRVGIPVFRAGKFWVFDFPNSCLWWIKGFETAKKHKEIVLDNYIVADILPVESLKRSHLVIWVETDFGKKKFAIDTCSEMSVLSPDDKKVIPPQKSISKKFKIGTHDYGKQELTLFRIFDEKFSSFDGILGIDFLKNKRVILNFETNQIFISL